VDLPCRALSIPICIADYLCFFFMYNWLMHFFFGACFLEVRTQTPFADFGSCEDWTRDITSANPDACRYTAGKEYTYWFFQVLSGSVNINPFTEDFDLPKRKSLNWFFLFFFDKVRHFLSKFSTLVALQKKCFLHFVMHWDVFLKKIVLQILLKIQIIILFLNFEKIFIFELVNAKIVFFTCVFYKSVGRRLEALKIENSHMKVKIGSLLIHQYDTFSGCILLAPKMYIFCCLEVNFKC
jgi:hypothetical protein